MPTHTHNSIPNSHTGLKATATGRDSWSANSENSPQGKAARKILLRRCFVVALAFVAWGLHSFDATAYATDETRMLVQVRVYRQPRPGSYQFLGNVPVQLFRNGILYRQGVTSTQSGQRTADFNQVPTDGRYSAKAFVGGRWINHKSIEVFQNRHRRIDIVIP